MLGRSILASSATSDNRMFIYEVEGLRQSGQTDQNSCTIRKSSTDVMQVPFNRMNEAMQRINRLGGKIIAIRTPNAE
jgi:phycocyanin-associated, rod